MTDDLVEQKVIESGQVNSVKFLFRDSFLFFIKLVKLMPSVTLKKPIPISKLSLREVPLSHSACVEGKK